MAEIYYNILDTNVIRSFAQAHIDAPEGMIKALDALFARGRVVVIAQEVLDEASNPGSQTWQAFNAWYEANKNTRIVTVDAVFDIDRARAGDADELARIRAVDPTYVQGKGLGDAAIRQFLLDEANSGRKYELVTNNRKDFSLRAMLDGLGVENIDDITHQDPTNAENLRKKARILEQMGTRRNVIVSEGATGFFRDLIGEKGITLGEAKWFRDNIRTGAFEDLLTSLDDERLKSFYDSDFVKAGDNWVSRARFTGISTRSLALAGTLLGPLGIVSDILTFGSTAAQAAVLRVEGKVKEANRLWAGYLGDLVGTAIGGAVGGVASSGLLRAAATLLTINPVVRVIITIAGAIGGSVAGSFKGKEFGEKLYDEHPEFFDQYLNPIYDALDALDPLTNNYDELTSEQFVETFIKGFGFSEDPNSASAGSDLLMAHKWTNLNGLGGDDVLVGWLPEFIARGEASDAAIREDERPEGYYGQGEAAKAIRDAYHARMSALADRAYEAEHDNDAQTTAAKVWQAAGLNFVTERAEKSRQMTLDGGAGNDWVITNFGEKSVTIGGAGRDWIFNTSRDGEIWGDTKNGLDPVTGNPIEDNEANSDNFWFFANTTIKDAQHSDVLKFFGLPLTGGNNNPSFNIMGPGAAFSGGLGLFTFASPMYFDHFFPHIVYLKVGNDLYIGNVFEQLFGIIANGAFDKNPFDGTSDENDRDTPVDETRNLLGFMKIENFDDAGLMWNLRRERDGSLTPAGPGRNTLAGAFGQLQGVFNGNTDLNLVFKNGNPFFALLALLPPMLGGLNTIMPFIDETFALKAASERFARALKWDKPDDPLILDLDGDGIELISIGESKAFFDVDGDFFRERMGWIKGDDGFLILDSNGNGRVDDISEMFGDADQTGFAELATYDSDGDGRISVGDAIWSELRVWRDRNEDGKTQNGELLSLADLGILSINLANSALNFTAPQGTQLLNQGTFTLANGRVNRLYDAIFEVNDVVTRFRGEAGRAPWQTSSTLNSKGFGTITDLAVATANDVGLAELAQSRSAAMTAPNLRTLVAQAGDVLGAWGMTLETSRELIAVRLSATGELLEHKLWDGAALGAGWTLEQAWSPTDRTAAELPSRDEAPYLTRIIGGRAVILDYGIKQADGTWKLASDPATIYATVADIQALAHPAGTEWRTEDIQFNPLASLGVEEIGVNFINGEAVDYTVRVTDNDGSFYVWARNLDRALQLQAKTGAAHEFNLRNYEVNLATLDEVNSTDDSTFRVELLTPAQFHFATSLGGIDFRPEMLTASYNNLTGQLDYTVNGVRSAGRYVGKVDAQGNPVLVTYSDGTVEQALEYQSDVKTMISLLQPVMEQYIVTSRRFAVRMALQGGLSEYARGLSYDAARDVYVPTTDRQMAPMFEAIFEDAPASNADDAIFDYLTDWNEILWQVYPDYAPTGSGNLLGAAVGIDQAFIMQMLIPAFEARGWTFDPATGQGTGLDIRGVAHALSVNEERIITHAVDTLSVGGTSGTDYFYMTAGDQTLTGGNGADFYFVGGNAGNDVIRDQDSGGDDELRFTAAKSGHVKAIRDGQDLILEIRNDAGVLVSTTRLTDQFLGELNPYLSNGKQLQSGVNQIVFADGVIWDRFRMAMQVADPRDTSDVYAGSGSGDVLWGGKGNDVLTGGLGGDIYIFQRGDGQDVLSERGGFSFGPGCVPVDWRRGVTRADMRMAVNDNRADVRRCVAVRVNNERAVA